MDDSAKSLNRVTRLMRSGTAPELPSAQCFEHRLALFVCAMVKQRAVALLEGLAEPQCAKAREYALAVADLDSPTRQGRIAVEFGPLPHASDRLRRRMSEAPERLRCELYRLLPSYHRTLFTERASIAPPKPEACPGMRALAERVVKEATH